MNWKCRFVSKKKQFLPKKTTKLNFWAKKHVFWFEKTKPLSLSVFQVGLPRRWCNLGSTLSFSDTFELKWTEKCRFCIKKEQFFTKTTQFWPKKPCFGLKKTKILSFSSCFVCLQRWWCKLGLIQSFSETSKHK
jgi:hypothetical protein